MIRIDVAHAARTGPGGYLQMIASPEEALIAWLVALPEGLDPAHAARVVLARIAGSTSEAKVSIRLRELLLEVTRCSVNRCPAPMGRRRRGKAGVSLDKGLLT